MELRGTDSEHGCQTRHVRKRGMEMRKSVLFTAALLTLMSSTAAYAVDHPEPFRVYLYNPSTGWSSWTNFYGEYHYTSGCSADLCVRYDVSIEEGSANSATRFLVDFHDNDTEFDPPAAMMKDEYSYGGEYDSYVDWGTYQRILSEYPIDIDWEDNQYIAIIPAIDGGSDVLVYVRVQLYTIGK